MQNAREEQGHLAKSEQLRASLGRGGVVITQDLAEGLTNDDEWFIDNDNSIDSNNSEDSEKQIPQTD